MNKLISFLILIGFIFSIRSYHSKNQKCVVYQKFDDLMKGDGKSSQFNSHVDIIENIEEYYGNYTNNTAENLYKDLNVGAELNCFEKEKVICEILDKIEMQQNILFSGDFYDF